MLMCLCRCGHRGRGRFWISGSVTLYLIPLRQVNSMQVQVILLPTLHITLGVQACKQTFKNFYMGTGDLNSCLQAYMVSTLTQCKPINRDSIQLPADMEILAYTRQ